MIRKISVFFVFYFLVINSIWGAESSLNSQWFIQVGAYNNLDNALIAKANIKTKMEALGLYQVEREFMNYLSIDKDKALYRILIGAYHSKSDAQMVQHLISSSIRQSVLVQLKKNYYDNFEYHYRITLNEVKKQDYLRAKKLSNITLSNNGVLEKRKYIDHAKNEDIKVIFDENKAKNMLSLDSNKSISLLDNSINCDNTITHFPMSHFYAYFPQEKIILMKGEGFNYVMFSLRTCDYTKRFPFYIQYNSVRKLRIHGDLLEPLGGDHFYIEINDEDKGQFVELFDIGAFFESYLDININHLFWSANSEIYFMRTLIDDSVEYYRLTISRI